MPTSYVLKTDVHKKPTWLGLLEVPVDQPPESSEYKRLVTWDRVVDVKLADDAPGYQEFLSWNNQSQHRVNLIDLPQNAIIFLGIDPLVAYCKHFGIMLHRRPRGGFTTTGPVIQGGIRFDSIHRAWAYTPQSGVPKPDDDLESRFSDLWMPESVLTELHTAVRNEANEVHWVSSSPIRRSFVYLDISGFSEEPAGHEALIISSLISIIAEERFWSAGFASRVAADREAMLCIGDGYIFVFRDPVAATYFAAYLARLIEVAGSRRDLRYLPVQFHFRIGVHIGSVYTFWDPGRSGWNYIGDGINGGARVLQAIPKSHDDIVYVSAAIREELLRRQAETGLVGTILSNMQNRGRYQDKHKNPWRVYELNHTAICENDMPHDLGGS